MSRLENNENENSLEINSKNSLAYINDEYQKPRGTKKRKLNEVFEPENIKIEKNEGGEEQHAAATSES